MKIIHWKRDSKGKYSSFKVKARAFSRAFVKRLAVGYTAFALMFIGALAADGQVKVKTVEAEATVATTTTAIPPILQKIAKCESKTGQYKDGQVTINASQDLGKFQINLPIWAKKATAMGLNLADEKDNTTFALYLFDNYGTSPWNSSAKCWQ